MTNLEQEVRGADCVESLRETSNFHVSKGMVAALMKEQEYVFPDKVRIEWRLFHTLLLLSATLITWGLYFYKLFLSDELFLTSKLLSVGGLYIDIVGVTIASLRTPYYGDFWGMEKLETEKERIEKRWFQRGMAIVALGLLLQVIANLL